MLRLTRIACKFVPPTLAVEYVKPGDDRKKVKELNVLEMIMMDPEDAVDKIEEMHPWIFTKTNGKREQFVRVFMVAQKGYLAKMAQEEEERERRMQQEEDEQEQEEERNIIAQQEEEEEDLVTEPMYLPRETDMRSSVESKRSGKSSGSRSRCRYGSHPDPARMSLNISMTLDHGLLSDLALMDDDELCE